MNYLVYLHSIWFTHRVLNKIFASTKNYKEVYENLSNEFLEKYFDKKQIEKILSLRQKINTKYLDKKIIALNISIITIYDKNYPNYLKNISNPPYFLYVRWKIDWNDNFFWVVWSRKISNYAKKSWEKIIPDLLKYFTIISWWAGWCDSLAHKICLEKWEKTIVVFWTWIDIIYPTTNRKMFEDVVASWWALISIFPIWTPWGIYTFPIRNEIVSWISNWLLVLEAWEKSWTLITSKLALEQWKNVFALPWDIFSLNSVWTNNLIKNSEAKLVCNVQDILDEYQYSSLASNEDNIIFSNDLQKEIFSILKYNLSLSIDELIQKTWLEYLLVSLELTKMELSWTVKKDIFWKYFV